MTAHQHVTIGPGFVWIVAYPKSGSTWLRLALWSLRHQGAAPDFQVLDQGWMTMASNRSIFDRSLGLDSAALTDDEISMLRPAAFARQAALTPRPQLRRTHEAWTLTPDGRPVFPHEHTRGIIYLVRDPRDLAISNAYHWRVDVDAAIALMAKADAVLDAGGATLYTQLRQPLGLWADHVESWTTPRGIPCMVLRYEDMLADPHDAFGRAAAFLNWPVDAATVEGTVRGTHFDRLQAAEDKTGFANAVAPDRRFFRRGRAQAWRGDLSPSQVARIEARHGGVMARFGYL